MARLIAVNNIDAPADADGDRLQINCLEKQENCSVQIEWPVKSNHLLPNKQSVGMKKSPSMSNFCSKRTPMNVQWKNISMTTKKGD